MADPAPDEALLGQLTPLEIAAGRALCLDTPPPLAPLDPDGPGGRGALESEILAAFERGPVGVSFSGGRDSSLVLAVACHVARRHGFALPRAITMRHGSPESDEAEWQELVVRHLGVVDWERVEVGDSMDLLGEQAAHALRVTGLLSPANAYLHLPVVAAMGSGTVLTGVGGDEMLEGGVDRLASLRWRGAAPRPRDLSALLLGLAPRRVRRAWRARDLDMHAPWLSRPARSRAARRLISDDVVGWDRWDRTVRQFVRSRPTLLGDRALRAIGALAGVEVASPLLSHGFADAISRDLGPAGAPGGRPSVMTLLGGDLLPPRLISRQSKATFSAMVFGPRYLDFAAGLTPDDVDAAVAGLIDVDRALHHASAEPVYAVASLVQHAWLRREGLG